MKFQITWNFRMFRLSNSGFAKWVTLTAKQDYTYSLNCLRINAVQKALPTKLARRMRLWSSGDSSLSGLLFIYY